MNGVTQRRLLVVAAAVAVLLVAVAMGSRWAKDGKHERSNEKATSSAPPTEGHALRADFMYPTGAGPGSIEGRVVDGQGKPVEGAIVSVAPRLVGEVGFREFRPQAALGHARTNAQGRYMIEGLAPGVLSVVASAAPFVPARREPLTLEPNAHLTGVDLRMEGEGVRLYGSVTDSGGGGIAHARILAAGFDRESEEEPFVFLVQGLADEDGKFELYLAPKSRWKERTRRSGACQEVGRCRNSRIICTQAKRANRRRGGKCGLQAVLTPSFNPGEVTTLT